MTVSTPRERTRTGFRASVARWLRSRDWWVQRCAEDTCSRSPHPLRFVLQADDLERLSGTHPLRYRFRPALEDTLIVNGVDVTEYVCHLDIALRGEDRMGKPTVLAGTIAPVVQQGKGGMPYRVPPSSAPEDSDR